MKLDKYTYCARLLPALLVVNPLLIVLFLILPSVWQLLGVISAAGLSTALTFLLAQCGRDMGKRKEPGLYVRLGGKPTSRLLRHSDGALSPVTKARYHDYLVANMPGFRLPTVQQEASDPATADRIYDSTADWLRARTRDKQINELLLAENTSFGFRRNLWAMKPIGVAFCIVVTVAVDLLFIDAILPQILTAKVALTIAGIMLAELMFWLLVATPQWVAVPAEAYARTLLEYCDRGN